MEELENMEEVILPIIALEAGFNGAVINITRDLPLYVRSDGSDLNDGYYNTPQHAFKTATRAYQEATKYALGVDAQVIINLAAGLHDAIICQGAIAGSYQEPDGRWKAAVVIRGVGAGSIVQGIGAAPEGAAVLAGQGARISVESLKIAGSANGLVAKDGGVLDIGTGMEFGAVSNAVMALQNGLIYRYKDYKISGGGVTHLYAFGNGVIEGFNTTVTFTTPVSYSDAFAVADAQGFIHDLDSDWIGTVTGIRFKSMPGGYINTEGSGLNYFPGTIPGVVSSGGGYDASGGPTSAAPKAMSLQLPVLNDEVTLFYTNVPIVISQMNAVLRGSSSPSVTWTLRYAATRDVAGTQVVTGGNTTTAVTQSAITTFNSPSIPVGNWVWLKVTATAGIVLEMALSLTF